MSLAAHNIALNIASVVFMVPLGISAAAAVLVGQHVGARDAAGARRAGWAAILVALAFMGSSAVAFLVAPGGFIRLYTREAAVIAIGSQLLGVAAAFQLFDGLQVTTTGALRGLGETRVPMVISLVGYWVSGLPLGLVALLQGRLWRDRALARAGGQPLLRRHRRSCGCGTVRIGQAMRCVEAATVTSA